MNPLAALLHLHLHLHLHQVHGVESHGKRKLWLLALMAGWQPVVMWWLTFSLVPAMVEVP